MINTDHAKKFVMAGLDPATQGRCNKLSKVSPQSHKTHQDASCTSWLRGSIFLPLDAATLGGRVKPGHDDIICDWSFGAVASSRETLSEVRA